MEKPSIENEEILKTPMNRRKAALTIDAVGRKRRRKKMRMKIKLFCIMLAVSSSWAYAKPKFEDIRVFEASSRGAIFIINGNEKAILSSPAGVFDIKCLQQGIPRGVFFIGGKSIVHIEETSWNKREQGYPALFENERVVFKPLDVFPKNTIQNVKLLHNSRRFSVYEKNASVVVFDIDTKKVVEAEKNTSSGKSFRDGSMTFLILDESKVQMYGNQGSDPIEFYRDKNCLIFTETTPVGSKHVFIISDKYDPSEMGFKYTYVRNTLNIIFSNELIRTTSHGIVKVDY